MSFLSQTLGEPTQKRRKIRKGTFSCWECKNRKIRCQFTPSSATACTLCQRKGLSCISQECPNPQDEGYHAVERRIGHVEGLVAQLVQHQKAHSPHQRSPANLEVNEDLAVDIIDPRLIQLPKTGSDATLERGLMSPGSVSYLRSLLPSAAILEQVLDRSPLCVQPFHSMIHPNAAGQVDQRSSSESNQPVHLARRIIQLALFLQQSTQKVPELRFDQPDHQMAHYFVGVASRYVTSQDLLVDSLDGLETLVLEAHYHIHVGSLRDAWLLFRRALGIARLLSLPCRKHEPDSRAESLWFRLVYSDRFLSLMLGLPFVDVDCQLSGERQLVADRWSDRLERIHVVVAGRIISRNLRMQKHHELQHEIHETPDNDYHETQDIDLQLKRASRITPVRWWSSPLLGNGIIDVNAPEHFIRIVTQMHQFSLVVALHQPHLIEHLRLESASAPHHQTPVRPPPNYAYSKQSILYASREVLIRFGMFRNSLQKVPYHGLVEKAFTSTMCLLLIHMDGHQLKTENVLEHQRPGDLAIINYVINAMEEVSRVHKEDNLIQSCVKILSTLVRMENYTANGTRYLTSLEPGTTENNKTQATIEDESRQVVTTALGRENHCHEY